MMYLKQSTAATVKLGPFVDSTDGKTAETALTLSQADIRLSKNGGAFAQTNNATGATHDENGYYGVPLDTTDTNTVGRLQVAVSESGALPVWAEYMVLPANVYDAWMGTDYLQVHAVEIANDLITAAAFDESTAFPLKSADTGATQVARVGADGDTLETLSDQLDTVTTDTNELQTDWTDGGRLDLIVDAILADTNELQTDDYPASFAALNDPTAAAIADAVWDEAATGHTDAGKAGAQLWTDLDAVLADTNELQGDWANGGRLDLLIDAIVADTNELQTDWTDAGRLDAILDAIVADTNELQTDDTPAAIAALNNLSAAQVNAEVVDALATDTYAESSAVPAATATLAAKIVWLATLARNKITQTATTQTLYADDGSTSVATSTVSDDATTATRGEFS